jgi:hypothetical protein
MTRPIGSSASSSAGGFAERAYQPRDEQPARERYAYAIRPTAGGIIGGTLSWWSGDVARLTLIGLVPMLVYCGVLGSVALAFGLDPTWLRHSFSGGSWWVDLLVGVAFGGFTLTMWCAGMAGVIIAADDHARAMRSFGPWSAFLQGLVALKRILPLAFAFVVVAFVASSALIGVVVMAVYAIAGRDAGVWGTMAVMIGGGLFIGARLAPLVPVYLLEDRSLFGGIARAWSLTRGHALSIIGAALVIGALAFAVSLATSLLQFIPFFGQLVGMGVAIVMFPIVHVFCFAVYAACSNESPA